MRAIFKKYNVRVCSSKFKDILQKWVPLFRIIPDLQSKLGHMYFCGLKRLMLTLSIIRGILIQFNLKESGVYNISMKKFQLI